MATNIKEAKEILELAVDVATDFEGGFQFEERRLTEEDLASLGNKAADFGFGEYEELRGLDSFGV
jgi:tellurite resistance protein